MREAGRKRTRSAHCSWPEKSGQPFLGAIPGLSQNSQLPPRPSALLPCLDLGADLPRPHLLTEEVTDSCSCPAAVLLWAKTVESCGHLQDDQVSRSRGVTAATWIRTQATRKGLGASSGALLAAAPRTLIQGQMLVLVFFYCGLPEFYPRRRTIQFFYFSLFLSLKEKLLP